MKLENLNLRRIKIVIILITGLIASITSYFVYLSVLCIIHKQTSILDATMTLIGIISLAGMLSLLTAICNKEQEIKK